jgi:hypothetical protein
MRHEFMALKGLVTWTKKYRGIGSYGYLNIDPNFEVRLEYTPGTTQWNLVIEKDYDAYLVGYPRNKTDAAYMIEDWIDRGMQMEYGGW